MRPKPSGECVFCGKLGVTKQHFWPDWIKSVIPREGHEHTQNLIRADLTHPGIAIVQPEIQFKKGPFGARKIRKVCAECNNGWMSRLETAAKPILTNLILQEEISLSSDNLKSIALWGVMTSIVAEYTDPPTQSIPSQHREHLKNNGMPPEGWHIWIGSYAGQNWRQRYRHCGLACVPNTGFMPASVECNTQSSTFVIGSLLIHAASSTFPHIIPEFRSEIASGLLQIWPSRAQQVEWPFAYNLNDEQVNEISDTLWRQLPMWVGHGAR